MERIGETLERQGHRQYDVNQLKTMILQDPDVMDFIQKHQLSQHEITISLTKFNQFIREREKFLKKDQNYVAKGYQPVLIMNDGYADVSYLETEELKQQQNRQEVSNRIELVNLPKSYRNITLEDIHLDDVNRIEIYKRIVELIKSFPNINKGIYLYGDMGIGKSFMLAALARELSEKHQASTLFLHYPSFTVDIKSAIKTDTVKDEIDKVKKAQVLILDDIGAEQSTPWLRDDVLQNILQYRMLEDLPTFFTSNYNFTELERHFAQVRNSGFAKEEDWQAKRVMERIRYLAEEFHLEGTNRRDKH